MLLYHCKTSTILLVESSSENMLSTWYKEKPSISDSVVVYSKGKSEMYTKIGSMAYNSHKALVAILVTR